jgi:NAD(P)H dehydrogenase (quinone)
MATGVMLRSLGRTRRGVIATILTGPAAHIGKTYTLCGPSQLDQAEIAATMTEVLGRKISYRPMTIPQYRECLEKAGLHEFMIQHFCAIAVDYQNGLFSGEDKFIAELTGKPPMTVRDFVASHREAFTTASAA